MQVFFKLILIPIFFSVLFFSCDDEAVLTPKPRGYPKIVFPKKSYQPFEEGYCNFVFEYPTYAEVQKHETFFGEKPKDECWFDIFIPQFDAKIYCTYSPIDKEITLEKLKNDAFELAQKHNIKAKYIEELELVTPNGVHGFAFNLEGEVASPFQFYLTDSKSNFVRGSLYFNAEVAPDSLAPALDFIKKDLEHMISTLRFK